MIILYDTTETKFESNGLGVLDHDIINPIIEESANGTFKLSFDYPLSGVCGNRIGRRMYIKADDPDTQGNIFKIYNFEKSDGILSVVAFQIANEFNNNWIEHTNIFGKNGQSALDQMKSNLTNSTRFNFYSDILTTANSEVVRLNPLTWLIDNSTDNSFVNRWGGEIKRDGFNIRMFKHRGANNGVQIRWRKNLSSYNIKWDDTTVVTRIRPVGYNGLTLPELYVDSPKLTQYGDPIIKEVKYDDIKLTDENTSSDDNAYKTVNEAYAALRKAAAKEFSENHLDDPAVTADVSMISLKNTREYADVAELETIKQWDTIQLINERDNVNIQMRLNSYKYNPLNHEFIELKFVSTNQALTSGNTNLSSVINGISSTVKNVQDTANQAQISANGKNMIDRGTADPNKLTFNGTLTDGDIYYRTNGDKKEMWFYSAKDKAWKLEVSDMTGQEIEDEVSQVKKDADKMRADAEAQLAGTEKQISDINLDLNKANDDIKSVDAKFNSKTDILNQAVTNVKSDLAEQVDNLKQAKANADQALSKANNVNSSVSTINTEIDKVNATLQLKAEKSDINTINKTVNNQQAQIDANTKGITLKADQTSVNTLNQTVTNQASKLSVLAGEMDQKTSKTEFNNLTGRVTNAEQQIKANSDGVTSTVSKVNQIQDQVNNSAVGTNILTGTSNTNNHSMSGTGWVLASSATNANNVPLEPNTTYTYSANIVSFTYTWYFEIIEYDANNKIIGYLGSQNITPTVGLNSVTIKTSSNAVLWKAHLTLKNPTTTQNVVWNSEKLEKGSHATDWSPNPADNATTTALNVIKQTADETYQGLFNADGSNKIDKTAQGLTAQIKTAQDNAISTASTDAQSRANNALNSAKSYADTTISAKAGEISAKLTSVQNLINDSGSANLVYNSEYKDGADGWNLYGVGYISNYPTSIYHGSLALGINVSGKGATTWTEFGSSSLVSIPTSADGSILYVSASLFCSFDKVSSGGFADWGVAFFDSSKKQIANYGVHINATGFSKQEKVAVPNNAAYVNMYYNLYGDSGHFLFSQPQITMTNTVVPYKPDILVTATQSYAQTLIDAKAGSLLIDLRNYATTQANSAKSAAISTASTDATNKANNALNSAKSYADTTISATVGTLNAKVSGADYHNLISMNGNGILLDAHGVNNSNKSIILSGDHVKIDSNNPVIIPNAAIGSLDAGKIRGGTLNFANINAINLNADSIAAGTISGVAIHQSSSGHDTWIDGNGIHDYDSSGNNAWIQKGKLQVYDSNNYGFFMSAGELQLTSAASWSTSANPMFGTIKRDSSIFSTSGNGMVIQGTDGLSMRSKSFKSFYGLVEQGSRYSGSGINIADSGILAASNGRISITGGTVYNEFLNKLPRVEIGTNRWDPNGTGGGAGQNIAMQANGVMIDVNGGIYINSYTGNTAEFHNMKVKANSFNTTSQLSLKTNISKIDPKIALEKIRQTNIYDYQYKDDAKKGSKKHYASFIIDDVNEVSEYTEPEEFLSEDRTGRDDGTQLAYATVAIQELSKQIEELKQEIENLKQK
ncbi:MAG: phage tail spike protein [Liquorilactobacillus ghanensis]|uniref:phage tail spike protein n=1 Tax=Liquorilactobacillus ghanensis TaxID=399370 RepID=UPI0039EC67CC